MKINLRRKLTKDSPYLESDKDFVLNNLDQAIELLERESKAWTVESVKAELPNVKVRLMNGEIVTGYVRGRKLKFAQVWTKGDDHDGWIFSWETIVHYLNEDRPLIVL